MESCSYCRFQTQNLDIKTSTTGMEICKQTICIPEEVYPDRICLRTNIQSGDDYNAMPGLQSFSLQSRLFVCISLRPLQQTTVPYSKYTFTFFFQAENCYHIASNIWFIVLAFLPVLISRIKSPWILSFRGSSVRHRLYYVYLSLYKYTFSLHLVS